MSIPDQSHINQVRDALWQRSGRASVMIGSGFSRNALKRRPDAHDPPSWQEVAKAVYEKLYPQSDNRGSLTLAEASSASGFLRLAQEYEVAFGRSDLHQFIRQVVRDEDFAPGDMHKRLLRLPWRDVFTTNWDTLLEKTRSFVADRNYSVVRNKNEFPLAAQPRIVKLHGSLPAHFPLIFTEEDYRTYPTKFAPFVNTVQQAMMETAFCLIGFSGDDPNFLEWSGWVRDNLGTSAPKIYLAGWLDLSPHRRRMLEDRNVVPIDLARHPRAFNWPEHLRHQYATEWILHTLERGQPYDVSEWPTPSSRQHLSVPEEQQPVEEIVSDVPKDEPEPGKDNSGNVSVIYTGRSEERGSEKTLVQKTLDIWKHNRRLYPGWLVAPNDMRFRLSWYTEIWEKHILSVISEYEPIERLKAIRELIWRREIVLDPIYSNLEELAQKTLDEINCQDRTINDVADTNVEWGAVREVWRNVALALVTAARLRFDRDVFDKRFEALEPFRRDHPDIDQRMHHEQCLWAISSLDFETLEKLLGAWQTEGCDPAWMLRKAALLIETNRNDDAVQLLNRALSTIRENLGDDRSVAGYSREGWALWLALPFEQEFGGPPSEKRIDAPPASQRWRELAHLKCDARAELHAYTEAIKGGIKKKEKLSFDLGVPSNREILLSNAERNQQIVAYRAVRLIEVAGLIPVNCRSTLELAADNLSAFAPELAVRLILRIADYDGNSTLTHVLSRTRVAAMPADLASTLAQICVGVIEYALLRIADTSRQSGISWIERLRVAIEALSRLVLRLDPEMAEKIFDKALEWYRNDHIAQHWWISQPMRHILERSFEALPESSRTEQALKLLGAPIVGLDNFVTGESRYPDPGYLLQQEFPPPIRTSDNENRWQETVSFLIRGLRIGDEARKRAAGRILRVAFWEQLTDSETSQVAQALWNEDHTGSDDLPSGTNLLDWEYFLLPEPESGIAEKRFRRKWLNTNSLSQESVPNLDKILWHVGDAIYGLNKHQRSLELSEEEEEYLVKIIKQWSETPMPLPIHPFDTERSKSTHRAIIGLQSILLEIQVPKSIAEKLYKKVKAKDLYEPERPTLGEMRERQKTNDEKVKALNESDLPCKELVAGIVKSWPDCFDDMAMLMRISLVSENADLAYNAAGGLYYWFEAATDSKHQLQPPPDDLIREIGIIIANRRKSVLGWALQVAKLVFEEGNQAQKDVICELVLQGLGYLVKELQYDRMSDEDNDVPFLRWNCFQLARVMAECGFRDNPTIVRWLESAEQDPMPEVRYAAISASSHQYEDKENADDEPDSHPE